MSQTYTQDHEKGNISDGQPDQHPSAPSQPPHGQTNIGNDSGAFFTMYSKIVEDDDNTMVERWKKDADGIIIFSGLFSAVIAALLVASIQDLRPNSQDRSAFYLEKMYQLQANPNAPLPSAVDGPPPFSPPRYAVWVNSLWFLSLVISLSCAMLATSLQQWARRYLRVTRPKEYGPQIRARTRSFFKDGVDNFHVPWAVDALPALVHLALFIFFAGLLIYLFNIDHTVFSVVVCWVALVSTIYGFITFSSVLRCESPYHSPLSLPARYCCAAILHAVIKVSESMARHLFARGASYRNRSLRQHYSRWIDSAIKRAHEEVTSKDPSKIDGRILEWTMESLGEDVDRLETLIESIPGFYISQKEKRIDIPKSAQSTIIEKLGNFLQRSLSWNSVSDSTKQRRLISCLNTASVALDPYSTGLMFSAILAVNWHGISNSIEIGHFLKSCDKICEGRFTPYTGGIIGYLIATAREHDDRWTKLVLDHLAISKDVLQDYLTQGDSLSLATLIHYIRFADRTSGSYFPHHVLSKLYQVDKIDARNTLPRLQHDFCALWNEVVREAREEGAGSCPLWILRYTLYIYIALHQGTDAAPTAFPESFAPYDDILDQPSSYPLCNIPGHHTHSTNHVLEVPIAQTALSPTT